MPIPALSDITRQGTSAFLPGGGVGGNTNASLSTDVPLAVSNTWYDGPGVALSAGTWLVVATLTQSRSSAAAETIFARVTDGATHHASTQGYHPAAGGAGCSLSMVALVTLTGAATVKIQASTSAGATTSAMRATLTANASGTNATLISAVRVA